MDMNAVGIVYLGVAGAFFALVPAWIIRERLVVEEEDWTLKILMLLLIVACTTGFAVVAGAILEIAL